MSAILKYAFKKGKQLRFSQVNYLNYVKKIFACDNYSFPKTRGNKNKQWTHSTLNGWQLAKMKKSIPDMSLP